MVHVQSLRAVEVCVGISLLPFYPPKGSAPLARGKGLVEVQFVQLVGFFDQVVDLVDEFLCVHWSALFLAAK